LLLRSVIAEICFGRNSAVMGDSPETIPERNGMAASGAARDVPVEVDMKFIASIGLAALLIGVAGCASSSRNQGSAPSPTSFESGPRVAPELPYRTGPGLPSNERDYPRTESLEVGP
jgi:hypothetical protein